MKAKHVFVTLGLALTMGLGVAAGLSHVGEMKQAKAWSSDKWSHIYIVGGFEESQGTFLEMTKATEESDYERTVSMKAGDWFKFSNAAAWEGEGVIVVSANWDQVKNQDGFKNLTTDAGESENHNFLINEDGNYRVYMERSAMEGVPSKWDEAEYGIHIEKVVEPDDPAKEDTYYVVGSETNWKYAGAQEMDTTSLYLKTDTALLLDYDAKKDEEIKVRARVSGVDHWYGVGGEGGANYKFDAAGTYDLYLNASKELFVADSTKRHMVHTNCYKNAGKAEEGTTLLYEYGYEGSPFTPSVNLDGYVRLGLYTSHPSNVEYVPEDLAGKQETVWFYADFMKIGTYLVGNEEFAGEGLGWNIKGGQLMTVPGNGNKYEAVVNITGASEGHPVKVKGVDYQANEALDSHYLAWSLGENNADYTRPTSISIDGDGNIVFAENGTFAIYVNNEDKVYFNMGFDAFNTLFLNEVGAVCSKNGHTVEELQTVWTKMAAAYGSLEASDKAKYNPAKTIDSGNEEGTDQEKVIAKYKYIVVTKYAGQFEDFIWGNTYSSNSIHTTNNTNNTALLVIVITTVSLVSVAGLFLVIRRRKHQ